jgi:hypothetical protein
MEILGGGFRWPDVMPNKRLILHERVVRVLEREKLKGFVAHPVSIKPFKNKRLLAKGVPQYYLLEITGRVDVDVARFEEDHQICPVCLQFENKTGSDLNYRTRPPFVFLSPENSDGSDLLEFGNLRPSYTVCTRKFIDLACQHQWTNFVFGYWVPQVGISEKFYQKPDWFERVTVLAKVRYPELFGLTPDKAKSLLPPKEENKSAPIPVPLKQKSESEEYEERIKQLKSPRFDLIEANFKCAVPRSLKELYENQNELLSWRFDVDIPLSDELVERTGRDESDKLIVECYLPILGETMRQLGGPDMEDFIAFATDGSGGRYCIEPRGIDPEVHLYLTGGGGLVSLDISLSRFLAAPRHPRDRA